MKEKHDRTIKELVTKAANIRQEIKDLILNLPDNRLSKKIGARSFAINSSDLLPDICLSPETYDFRYQYKKIIEYLDETPIEKVYDRLHFMFIPNARGIYWYIGPPPIRLHPTVVKNVKKILKME